MKCASAAASALFGIGLLLQACSAQPAAPTASVKVFKSLGSLQCEGGGTPLPELAAELRNAGIVVRSSACGSDGRMRPAACGRSDGRIGIFEIPAASAAAAESKGFAPLARLHDAEESACR